MIILGIILLIIGFIAKIVILWTIGIIVLLAGLVLAVLGRAGHAVGGWRQRGRLQAAFNPSRQHASERRRAELMLRDDEHDGASPHVRVDLDGGRVMITQAARSPSAVDSQPGPLAR